MRNSDLSDQ
jgi:hypothetical protein